MAAAGGFAAAVDGWLARRRFRQLIYHRRGMSIDNDVRSTMDVEWKCWEHLYESYNSLQVVLVDGLEDECKRMSVMLLMLLWEMGRQTDVLEQMWMVLEVILEQQCHVNLDQWEVICTDREMKSTKMAIPHYLRDACVLLVKLPRAYRHVIGQIIKRRMTIEKACISNLQMHGQHGLLAIGVLRLFLLDRDDGVLVNQAENWANSAGILSFISSNSKAKDSLITFTAIQEHVDNVMLLLKRIKNVELFRYFACIFCHDLYCIQNPTKRAIDQLTVQAVVYEQIWELSDCRRWMLQLQYDSSSITSEDVLDCQESESVVVSTGLWIELMIWAIFGVIISVLYCSDINWWIPRVSFIIP